MVKFKNKLWIYNSQETIALTKARSKEEAMYKFQKLYPEVTGDKIQVAEYNHLDIAVVQKGSMRGDE